jgi:hypothetical protein
MLGLITLYTSSLQKRSPHSLVTTGSTPLPAGHHAYLQGLRKRANEFPRTQNEDDSLVLGRCALVTVSKFEGFSDAELMVAHEAREASPGGLESTPLKRERWRDREPCP